MRALLIAFLILLCGAVAHAVPAAEPAQNIYALPATPLQDAGELHAFAGQPTIIVLFQPDCPWCLLQFKESNKLMADYPKAQIIAISLRGSRAALLHELRRGHADMPAFRGSPALIRALGDPQGTPRTFVISAGGKLLAQGRGLQKADKMKMVLRALVE